MSRPGIESVSRLLNPGDVIDTILSFVPDFRRMTDQEVWIKAGSTLAVHAAMAADYITASPVRCWTATWQSRIGGDSRDHRCSREGRRRHS
jgi:hypothetical protein